MMAADAEKSTEGHVDSKNATTYLLDQQPFDGADPVVLAVEYGRTFDAIASDN